jgi:hypothetical protein
MRKFRSLVGVIFLVVGFFGIAGVGWLRERHDVRVMREKFQREEAEVRGKLEEIGEGVLIGEFNRIFPNARRDEGSGEWSVWIPTGYEETPFFTNISDERVYFELEDGVVRQMKNKRSAGGLHADRFGPGGFFYYFLRAWRSSDVP